MDARAGIPAMDASDGVDTDCRMRPSPCICRRSVLSWPEAPPPVSCQCNAPTRLGACGVERPNTSVTEC